MMASLERIVGTTTIVRDCSEMPLEVSILGNNRGSKKFVTSQLRILRARSLAGISASSKAATRSGQPAPDRYITERSKARINVVSNVRVARYVKVGRPRNHRRSPSTIGLRYPNAAS